MNNGPNHPGGGGGGGNPGGGGRRRRGRRGKRGAAHQGKGAPQPGNQTHGSQHGGGGGSQRSGGGGFRRRRSGGGGGGGKQSQPSIYSAPMDHSYRAVMNGNGNVADGQRGRGPRPGFGGTQYVQPDPEPIRVRSGEPQPTRIYAFIDDLFFLAKIREVSKKLNIPVEFVRTDKEMFEKIEAQPTSEDGAPVLPALVIVDLNNAAIKPLSVVKKLKTKLKKNTSIVGFLSHIQGELKLEAQEAGCDMVVPRSAFSQNLPNLLRRHAAQDEEEI